MIEHIKEELETLRKGYQENQQKINQLQQVNLKVTGAIVELQNLLNLTKEENENRN